MSDDADGPSLQLVWAGWAVVFTSTVAAVSLLLSGEGIGAAGFATAAIAGLGWVQCAERWRTWRHVALTGKEPPREGR